MISAAHIGAIAAASQQAAAGAPGNAHRYWRMSVTGIAGGDSRVSLAEIEFWDRRYARRLSGTYSESGATSSTSGIAYNGVREFATTPAQTYWISNDMPGVWLKVDAGAPVELAAVVLWRSNLTAIGGSSGNHITAFDVQYSDDDSTWTTLWSESGSPLIPDAKTPGLFENPYYPGDPGAPELDPAITPLHWLKLDGGVYSDAGTTPAANNDGIYQATNYGTDGTAFLQTTSGLRPTFRTGGLNGKPFLRCAYAAAQRFADIAIAQPSGFTALNPYCVVAVTDNVDLTDSPALIGSTATNGGKIGCYFRPTANEQIHTGRADLRFGNIENPQVLLLSRQSGSRFVALLNGVKTIISGAYNETNAAISAANLLWNDGITGDGYYDGELYELMYIDANINETSLFRISEYLNAKYGGIY